MKSNAYFRVAYLVISAISLPAFGQEKSKPQEPQLRDWSLADGSQESGELISVEIVVRLANGEIKNIPFSTTSRADQKFVTHWLLTNKNAKAAAPIPPVPIDKAAAKPGGRKPAQKQFTLSGDLKLDENEIKRYLEEWKTKKREFLGSARYLLIASATANGATPDVIQEAKDTYKLLSRDDVLIVPRERGCEDGAIYKFGNPNCAYSEISVLKKVDKRTIYASVMGQNAYIEGVETAQIPIGGWRSQYLFKKIGSRSVPAVIGEDSIPIIQAVSLEGFPKDIILW